MIPEPRPEAPTSRGVHTRTDVLKTLRFLPAERIRRHERSLRIRHQKRAEMRFYGYVYHHP